MSEGSSTHSWMAKAPLRIGKNSLGPKKAGYRKEYETVEAKTRQQIRESYRALQEKRDIRDATKDPWD